MEIRVSWVKQAITAAELRTDRNTGSRGRYGVDQERDAFRVSLVGCLGEVAMRQALGSGHPWVMDAPDCHSVEGDVGHVQVRATTHPEGRLILHPTDEPEATFYLVRLHAPDVEHVLAGRVRPVLAFIVGSVLGREGMRPEFWRDPAGGRPAYFVPDFALGMFIEKVAVA